MRTLLSRARSGHGLDRLSLVGLLILTLGALPSLALAAGTPSTSTTPTSAIAPVAGEIVIQPRSFTSIGAINAKFGTTTLFQFTDSTAVLVATSDLNGTLALL